MRYSRILSDSYSYLIMEAKGGIKYESRQPRINIREKKLLEGMVWGNI